MKQVRQGDIMFEKVDRSTKIDPDKYVKTDSNTVALGEVTGHSHRLTGQFEHYIERSPTDIGEQFIVAFKDTAIAHDEHSPLVLEEGMWRSWRQRSLDPTTLLPRQVID